MRYLFNLSLALCLMQYGFGQTGKLALTPPMGWNSWNTFQTNISESLVKETADMMVSSGMRDAGYVYLILDDGWMTKERDSVTGDLVADPKKFPGGITALADYIHAKGLKFGLYNCAGTLTCAGYPGTRGYEYQDARYYAAHGVDYLKFDWCSSEGLNAREAYGTMANALKKTGRPIIFSLCEWGNNKPWLWGPGIGQLWRTTGDITAQFDGVKTMGTWSALGITTIIEKEDTLRRYAGPGHWNDPDMLEVGNGLTSAEDRAHFAMWAMLAAPLIAGNDVRKMNAEVKALLTNKAVIAIDQDVLGIQGFRLNSKDSIETWCKPLANDEWAICFFNRSKSSAKLNVRWTDLHIHDEIFNKTFDSTVTYKVNDLINHSTAGSTKNPINITIAGHDVLLVRLTK